MRPSSCPAEPLEPGHRCGAFTVQRVLRSTAFATSYEARDPDGETVHLKIYTALRPDTEAGRGFERAQRAAIPALLRVGAGVGTIRSFDASDDHFVKIGHWVTGVPLADAYGTLKPGQGLALAAALARTVAALHDVGVVHRDLAPSNLLLWADGLTVVDFDGAAVGDEPGHPLSSPPYAAPEHYGPVVPADPRPGDVFTMGVVIYELTTGWFPYTREELYEGETFSEQRFLAAVERAAPPVAEDLPDGPSALRSVLSRCLHYAPGHRPTAREVASVLAGLVDGR